MEISARSLFLAAMAMTAFAVTSAVAQSDDPLPSPTDGKPHKFEIGEKDFLIDGKPIEIRCGEIHFARVPREYWRNRLKSLKAMGLNAVCAYLFWNVHEWEPGKYNWEGQADAAEFCRIAQEEGLWVVLRPGPYACAEWDGGGLPWWLLKDPDIKLRSSDPAYLKPAAAWIREVGRELSPLQVSKGGPILLVQAENEYGFFGEDSDYMGRIRQALVDGGFEVPLFACNPVSVLGNAFREDLFLVVNFGRNPERAFDALRQIQAEGPLMCGEFYPGWFDTWGATHHYGDTPRYLEDLGYMLDQGASFSIYMAHGGTSFGMWAGADRPFKPDTSSYDYDAPLSEAGWTTEKFEQTRDLMAKHLLPGETIPDAPERLPVMTIDEFELTQIAPLFDNLPEPVTDDKPLFMEAYDQGRGCILYRATLPAGPAAALSVEKVGDFAWVYVDGEEVGIMDRRSRTYSVQIPAREKDSQLDILVYAMGHVNFGVEIHDRKGVTGPVKLTTSDDKSVDVGGPWKIFRMPLDEKELAALKWTKADGVKSPAFWRGTFTVDDPADTFLDMRTWGKGVIWVNGHCLARYWNIGPTQTAFMPGAWLKKGENEIIILDLLGPEAPKVAGLEKPILDELRLKLDFVKPAGSDAMLNLEGATPTYEGEFPPGGDETTVKFDKPVKGRQFTLEMLDSHDGEPFAVIAELDPRGPNGERLSHVNWSIAYADSQEHNKEDGSASNAIDGQEANYWHSEWSEAQPPYPHSIVIDFGEDTEVGGFRFVPRSSDNEPGRVKSYRVYVGENMVETKKK